MRCVTGQVAGGVSAWVPYQYQVARSGDDRRGLFLRPGVVMLPVRGDGYLTTAEAARKVGVDPSTISQWRKRGNIRPDGLDERERPLYRPETVVKPPSSRCASCGLETTTGHRSAEATQAPAPASTPSPKLPVGDGR